MAPARYALVLTERLGAEGYAALEKMADEREQRTLERLDLRVTQLEQAIALLGESLLRRFDGVEHPCVGVHQRLDDADRRFVVFEQAIDNRFTAFEQAMSLAFSSLGPAVGHRFERLHQALDNGLALQAERLERRIAEECGALRVQVAEVRTDVATQRADTFKWAMVFWVTQAAAAAGLIAALR